MLEVVLEAGAVDMGRTAFPRLRSPRPSLSLLASAVQRERVRKLTVQVASQVKQARYHSSASSLSAVVEVVDL